MCIPSGAQGWAWAQSQALEYHASASSRADRLFAHVKGLYIDRGHMESLVGVLWAFAAADDGAGDGDCAKVLARLRELEVGDSDPVSRRSKKARTRTPSPSPTPTPTCPSPCSSLRPGPDGDATASAVAALLSLSLPLAAPYCGDELGHALRGTGLAAAFKAAIQQKQAEIRVLREAFECECQAAVVREAERMVGHGGGLAL
jgi:hypothetical protein